MSEMKGIVLCALLCACTAQQQPWSDGCSDYPYWLTVPDTGNGLTINMPGYLQGVELANQNCQWNIQVRGECNHDMQLPSGNKQRKHP